MELPGTMEVTGLTFQWQPARESKDKAPIAIGSTTIARRSADPEAPGFKEAKEDPADQAVMAV
jgi:hypothetical protein